MSPLTRSDTARAIGGSGPRATVAARHLRKSMALWAQKARRNALATIHRGLLRSSRLRRFGKLPPSPPDQVELFFSAAMAGIDRTGSDAARGESVHRRTLVFLSGSFRSSARDCSRSHFPRGVWTNSYAKGVPARVVTENRALGVSLLFDSSSFTTPAVASSDTLNPRRPHQGVPPLESTAYSPNLFRPIIFTRSVPFSPHAIQARMPRTGRPATARRKRSLHGSSSVRQSGRLRDAPRANDA